MILLISNKVRKYKIIYFLFGSWINKTKRIDNFFSENYNWSAFQQGPVIEETYKNKEIDKKILLNYELWSNDEKEYFKSTWNILNKFSNEKLIFESHKTTPWKNNWKMGSYYSIISNEEIINWFIENDLFFSKYL